MQKISKTRFMITVCLCLFSAIAAQASSVYTVNTTSINANPTGNPLQSDSVFGSITTDGTLGILSANNILNWDLNLIDNLNSANDFHLTTANSEVVHVFGSALSATATGLSFDYSIPGAEFLIQGNVTHAISSGWNYFCFSATGGWCLAGETIAPQYVYTDGVIVTGAAAPIDQQPLNQHPVAEPSIIALFMLGFLSLIANLKPNQRRFKY